MTNEEMKQKIAHIERVSALQKKAVYREFVESNAKHKIGDIVSDENDIIRVESISYSIYNGEISIFYLDRCLPRKANREKMARIVPYSNPILKLNEYAKVQIFQPGNGR